MMRWLVVIALVACEKPDEGVALGWHPIAVGQQVEVRVHTEHTLLHGVGDNRRDQLVRFEVLGVDGERAMRIRYTSLDDHRVVGGKEVPAIVGVFDARRGANGVEVTKEGGTLTEAERREVTPYVTPMFETMQLQRGFFTHRFRNGETYVPTKDDRTGLGIPEGARVTMTLLRRDAGTVVIGFDGEDRLEPPVNGIARTKLGGHYEGSTDQKRLHVVTDTDLFDGNGQPIGHSHFDSMQVYIDGAAPAGGGGTAPVPATTTCDLTTPCKPGATCESHNVERDESYACKPDGTWSCSTTSSNNAACATVRH
jgi:hypothetical protein